QQHDERRSRLVVILEQQRAHACGFRLDKVLISPIARIDVIVKIHRAAHQSGADRRFLARLSHRGDPEWLRKESNTDQDPGECNKEHAAIASEKPTILLDVVTAGSTG